MLVFVRKNLVLLATPKTGSTALHMALAPHADMVFRNLPQIKHIGLQRYMRFVRPLVMQYTDAPVQTCALIREPEDWLGSWYRYRKRDSLVGGARSTRGVSFEAYVDGYLSDQPPEWASVGAQSRFLTNPRNGARVDTLFRYDAMDSFVAWLSERLGCVIELPIANASPKADLDLSDAARARLRAARPKCFALYDRARH